MIYGKKLIRAFKWVGIILSGILFLLGCEHPVPVESEKLEATLGSIQANIFNRSCAVSNCHVGNSAPLGLDLSEGKSYANLVNVPSSEAPGLMRVKPSDPDNSYLVHKIEGGPNISGDRMPLGRSPLSQEQIQLIRQWIADGAPANGGVATTAPVVSNIPDQTIVLGDTFAPIPLDDFVQDPDHDDSQITWSFSYQANGHLSVTIDMNRVARIHILDSTWTGSVSVTFTATDPDGLSGSDMASFTITEPDLSRFSQIQIQVFTPSCAISGCHSGSNPAGNLNLSPGQAYSNLVNVPSTTDPDILRVEPGKSDKSMLMERLKGDIPPQMPLIGGPLENAVLDSIEKWIDGGAPNN
ncbi:MAG: hypothetical protein Kow0042_16110 [Calditrichia bacterium]